MKKANNIIKAYNEYEFKLAIPTKIDKNNKIEVYFNFLDPSTNKNKQIKRSTGIDRYAEPKIYRAQALFLVDEIISLLKEGWNPITNSMPDYMRLTPNSKMQECIDKWLEIRETDFNAGKMKKPELDATKMVFQYYAEYLTKNNTLFEKPSTFTKTDIDMFMRKIEKQRRIVDKRVAAHRKMITVYTPLAKPTYNAYVYRLSYFFEFLISERIIHFNPCKDAFKYKTRQLATRFKVYDDTELETVKNLLAETTTYRDLYIASLLTYRFRIRAAEQMRIRLGFFDFTNNILTLPAETTDKEGKTINMTKNGNAARLQIHDDVMQLIIAFVGEDNLKNKDWYLFSGHCKSGAKPAQNQLFTNRWRRFKAENHLPKHLKFYALKHTANFNDHLKLGSDGLMVINRHASPSQSHDYYKHQLNKLVITVAETDAF